MIDLKASIRFVHLLWLLGLSLLVMLFSASCGRPVNTIADPHFSEDGYCLDSLRENFRSTVPSKLTFYVEVSGSMNGFFRANMSTRFKRDVWSVVSNFGGNDVVTLSNSGVISGRYSVYDFRTKMNTGAFVSAQSTRIPTMLGSILSSMDYLNGECAVLISDMKYDPYGQQAVNALLDQYQSDIRNVVGKYEGLALSLIMSTSDYAGSNGQVLEPNSPYYYLIMGRDSEVARMRNCIATLLEDNGSFGDCIETGFDYKSPIYSFGMPDNVMQLGNEPAFTNYDTSFADTCALVLNIDLSDYRWTIAEESIFRSCFSAKSAYGAEVIVGEIDIAADNHFDKKFERKSVARVELKICNMHSTSDVIEWTLKQPEHILTQNFIKMIGSPNVNDLSGSFSVDRFITGMFNATQNSWDMEPNRILISKTIK